MMTYWPSDEADYKTDKCKIEWIKMSMHPVHGINYDWNVALKFQKELLEKGVLKQPIIPVHTNSFETKPVVKRCSMM